MTSLSDTPTPVILHSVSNNVSIKIEQGVLSQSGKDEGSKLQDDKKNVPIIKCESSLQSTNKNILNGMNEDFNMINITHSIFQTDFAIKTEPGVDIDDRQPEEEPEHLKSTNKLPKITLTPTSKLVASPNGDTDKKRRYFCTYENCTKSYGKSSHLRSHLTWHTGIKPFVCKEPSCGKGFTRSDELNRHIRTHTGEKPFECVQCTKKFSRSDHLTKHLATHTKQLSAQSGILSKKKLEKNILPSAARMVPASLTTNIDGRGINLVSSFERNSDCRRNECEESLQIKQEQPDNNVVSDVIQDAGAYSSFSSSDKETKNEYNIIIKPEPIVEPQVIRVPQFSNDPDDDAIMPEANLPPLTENATHGSVVKVEESLLLKDTIFHMADSVYDPSRPFPCCHCAKNFKRQDDLNRHLRTHTGEKPFACGECDKRFMRSDHLKKHLKTHTKVR